MHNDSQAVVCRAYVSGISNIKIELSSTFNGNSNGPIRLIQTGGGRGLIRYGQTPTVRRCICAPSSPRAVNIADFSAGDKAFRRNLDIQLETASAWPSRFQAGKPTNRVSGCIPSEYTKEIYFAGYCGGLRRLVGRRLSRFLHRGRPYAAIAEGNRNPIIRLPPSTLPLSAT